MRLRRTPHAPLLLATKEYTHWGNATIKCPRHVPPRRMCGRAPKGSCGTLGYLDHLVHRTWR